MNNMDNVNIKSKKWRREFMDSCGGAQLNKHINTMEQLACMKGGWLTKAYGEDLKYILRKDSLRSNDNSINMLVGGRMQQLGPPNPIYKFQDDIFRKILDINPRSYCALITQKTPHLDARCANRVEELDRINQSFEDVIENRRTVDRSIYRDIRNFIELIICCSEEFMRDKTKKDTLVNPIMDKITNIPILTEIAYKYIQYILKNENNRYIKDYKKLTDEMEELKKTGLTAQYDGLNQQHRNMIKQYGPNLLYITGLINWIYDQYEANKVD